jgi:hypothetical protein
MLPCPLDAKLGGDDRLGRVSNPTNGESLILKKKSATDKTLILACLGLGRTPDQENLGIRL